MLSVWQGIRYASFLCNSIVFKIYVKGGKNSYHKKHEKNECKTSIRSAKNRSIEG